MSVAAEVRVFLEELGGCLEKWAFPRDVTVRAPEELHLELTYNCDSECVMCNLRYLKEAGDVRDISLKEIENLVNGSRFLEGIRYIVLSGGEPWMNAQFNDIISFFRGRYPGADILILSNLYNTKLIREEIEKVKSKTGLQKISMGSSLDGVGKVHDSIRGARGAFKALMKTTEWIIKHHPSLKPVFNFTLIPANSGQLYKVFKWARENSFTVSYQVVVQKPETARFEWSQEDLKKIDSDIDRITGHIYAGRGWDTHEPGHLLNNPDVLFFLLNFHYMRRYLRNPSRYFPTCLCGEKYAMINPRGELYFCPVNKHLNAGNIRVSAFDQLWDNPRAREIRAFFNRKECHCWLSCTNSGMLADAFFRNRERIFRKYMG
ncbi:MAG: radical SAM protein [Elusimicrobia bacterium]|nr:radical SAM protein [Elusimicrobiota bacterium]